MNSIIFSDDEARYLRVLMRHVDKPPDEHRASWVFNGFHIPEEKVKPVGEFKVLVIGAKGVGKTCLLKVSKTMMMFSLNIIPVVDIVKACTSNAEDDQHTITLKSNTYKVNTLELPFTNMTSPEAVQQLSNAIAMTEAAVLVYDIADLSSLTYLKSLSRTFYDALHYVETMATKKKTTFPFSLSHARLTTTTLSVPSRPYNFLLLGTKNDIPALERDVSWIEGHRAAYEFFGQDGVAGGTSVDFLEVSSCTGDNIDSVFPLLGREIMRSRHEHQREQQEQREKRDQRRLVQQMNSEQRRPRGGAVGLGAFDGWGCSDFEFDVDDDDDCYESLMDDDTDDEGAAGGTRNGALSGSMRRHWGALKATLSGSLFKKDMKL